MLKNLIASGEAGTELQGLGDAVDIGEIFNYVTQLLTEFWPLVALAIGIPLGFYLIRRIIGLIRG